MENTVSLLNKNSASGHNKSRRFIICTVITKNGRSFNLLVVFYIIFIFTIFRFTNLVDSAEIKRLPIRGSTKNDSTNEIAKSPEDEDEDELQSLYDAAEPILQLSQFTFDKNVYKKRKAFFVEFYSSWCGHCVNFAPTYAAFARQVVQWQSIVEIAAVNCALEANFQLCQDHNIELYPTLRYFKYYSTSANDSERFAGSKQTQDALTYGLIQMIYADWQKQKPPAWPYLDYEKDDATIAELWSNVDSNVNFFAIVVENQITKFAGAQLKLEFYDYRSKIAVKTVTNDSYVAQTYSITDREHLPGLLIMKRGIQTPYFVSKKALTSMDEAVSKIVYHTQMVLVNKTAIRMKKMEEEKKKKLLIRIDPKMKTKYFVHKSDLLSALRYTCYHEIAKFKKITGDKWKVLQNFMEVVLRYFPSNIQEKRYLFDLTVWLNGLKDGLDSKMWENKLNQLQTQYGNPLPTSDKWVSCKGSKPRFRKYPCSLWMLFHTLTAFAYKMDGSTRQFDAKEIIKSFRDFTREFFGCEECKENFQRETVDFEKEIGKAQDVVLYLWRVHNKVNLRLKGTMTEDPDHPKVQFPPAELCSVCYNARKNVWNEEKTLEFLLQFYSDVKTDGLADPNEIVVDNPDVNGPDAELMYGGNSNLSNNLYNNVVYDKDHQHAEPVVADPDKKQKHHNHSSRLSRIHGYRYKTSDDDSMNSFDFSLCLVLWLSSSFIVLFLFVFFKMRRSNKYKFCRSYVKF